VIAVHPCSPLGSSAREGRAFGSIVRVRGRSRSFRDIWFSPRGRFSKNKEYAPEECAGAAKASAPAKLPALSTGGAREPRS
jgi:hypothetical protein